MHLIPQHSKQSYLYIFLEIMPHELLHAFSLTQNFFQCNIQSQITCISSHTTTQQTILSVHFPGNNATWTFTCIFPNPELFPVQHPEPNYMCFISYQNTANFLIWTLSWTKCHMNFNIHFPEHLWPTQIFTSATSTATFTSLKFYVIHSMALNNYITKGEKFATIP